MSLIKCPECSKEVSNKSHFCIHCGYPFNNSQSVNDLDEYKIGLGIYRAGIDFPRGEISIQADILPKFDVFYRVSKTPRTNSDDGYFKDKVYVHICEGQYLRLSTHGSENITFTVKIIKKY